MTLLGAEKRIGLTRLLRGDAHNYIELALTYSAAGLYEDAVHILQTAPKPGEPLQHYYLYLFTGDGQELTLAESAPSLYCFPNRLEDITALGMRFPRRTVCSLLSWLFASGSLPLAGGTSSVGNAVRKISPCPPYGAIWL